MADKKLSEFDEMGFDKSTPVYIPAVRYSSSEAGATKENRNIPLDLFFQPSFLKYEWSDCLRNEACWLRADTFSWHSGDSQYANSYENVYNHLVDDIDGKSLTSETIAGITIQYYLVDDKHKICPASQEENLISLYNTVGIAWYYIIDTTNTRFKLPRTKFGFTGLRDEVGKYVPETAPKIAGELGAVAAGGGYQDNTSGCFSAIVRNDSTGTWGTNNGKRVSYTFDSSRSSSSYQTDAPVQQRATQMYLYCYVGKFSNSAIVNIAGEHTELFNDKVDRDLKNVDLLSGADAIIDRQEPTAENNYTWYRLYASGRVEQGGYNFLSAYIQNAYFSQALPIPMVDINYEVILNFESKNQTYHSGHNFFLLSDNYTTTTFNYAARGGDDKNYKVSSSWEVKGMADLT